MSLIMRLHLPMKTIQTLFFLCLFVGVTQAQTEFDALRYSNFFLGGTARTVGIGGAIGALGADFSTMSSNPAGLATFRRSEFTATPAVFNAQVTSQLEGDNLGFNDERGQFNFNNLGLIGASRPSAASKWKTANFGIGFNRIASFHQTFSFSGTSPGSITDRFLEQANGFDPNDLYPFEEGLAYDAAAIFRPSPTDQPTTYLSDFVAGELVDKSQTVRTKGSINEMVIGFAGNYDEKIMVGATVGIPFVNYEEDKNYLETDEFNNNPTFNLLIFEENLITSGSGINMKMGVIYRPTQMLRIGAAIHTPTFFRLEDSFNSRMTYEYEFEGTNRDTRESPDGFFEYRLRTPWRMMGSAAVLIKKFGFITGEIEYVDYGSSRFNFLNVTQAADLEFERDLNNQVSNTFSGALNIKIGGEAVLANVFRLRAGYNLLASPFIDNDEYIGVFSAGAGLRERNFFIDLAFRTQQFTDTYSPYRTAFAGSPEVSNDVRLQEYLLTIGFKF
jgi:hypothetical protein